jgi:Putative peptidoglycan binding domain
LEEFESFVASLVESYWKRNLPFMKTSIFSVLALAAVLQAGAPAFTYGKGHGGGHRGGGHSSHGGGHAFASHGSGHSFHGGGRAFAPHSGHSFVFGGGGSKHPFGAIREGGASHNPKGAFPDRRSVGSKPGFGQAFGRGALSDDFRRNGPNGAGLGSTRGAGAARAGIYGGNSITGVRGSRSFGSRPGIAFGGSAYANGVRGNARGIYRSHGYGGDGRPGYRGYGDYGGHDNGWYPYENDWGYPYYGYGSYSSDRGGALATAAQVQEALEQQGYYQGPIDGVVGPGTQAAIAAYQQANGLPVTGSITAGLLQSLGLQ